LRPLAPRAPVCAQIPLSHSSVPLVSRDVLAAAHRLGLQVHVWTINDTAVMERLLDAGVDGIVTDNTEGLRQVLMRRGAWHDSTGGPVGDR
ncbi:glycerophosphodiester phosphodiesterase family protein, partial [Streptomonospora algeriensis]